ncbi:plasmid stabilization system protein [Desulfitobacterium dichloroeliminans LMG P-21439]|uniref:Plasmid stabilization system protein n=1 Tax=Desulfitobacterium dichloroeliminans (strain LMG P-21439 / DCA1) TaxID=871963 RepID=L0F6Q2_DESDL|nr:type II toxin-antitoxin system RelE/ParE family toxin [Desulfitobacterium dichloroeliminans]AGA68336.1 plasmid stabilization system protein [Desulfitobacterium dichloroeliminans LMG P-21439]
MGKVEYSPKAQEDLWKIRAYIIENFGIDTAQKALVKITASINRLGEYPLLGVSLSKMFDVSTDYMYLFCGKNYVFYRIEGNIVKVVRVLNEQQDFLRVLFEIYIDSDEDEDQ